MSAPGTVHESPLIQHARRLPAGDALMDWGPVRHVGSAARLGTLVRESTRFAAADLLGLHGLRRYHLRSGGRPVPVSYTHLTLPTTPYV